MSPLIPLAGTLAVALANGANDNFKGVATLFASGNTSYRAALIWATATTFAGAIVAAFVGARLAVAFSGGGLLPAELVAQPAILAAVAAGTALTVGIAARAGMPISTTHAILGALVGAGAVAAAGQLHLGVMLQRFVAPLILSPIVAFALVAVSYPVLSHVRRRLGVEPSSCLCIGSASAGLARADGSLVLHSGMPVVHRCDRRYAGSVVGVDAGRLVSGAHFISAGLQSFARGLNDTMTHVAVGSLAGLGWSRGQAQWSMLRRIAWSWLLTLPLGAALGALAFMLIERIYP